MAWAVRGMMLAGIRTAAQTTILKGIKLNPRFLSSSSSSSRVIVNPTEDDIISSASSVFKRHVDAMKADIKNKDKLVKVVLRDPVCKTYPFEAKLMVTSKALDLLLQNYPQVDHLQVFFDRLYIITLMSNNNKDSITKDEAISRVLDVIKCHPKVDRSKVTSNCHLNRDLGLNEMEIHLITCGIVALLKLPETPATVFYSCNLLIDYIYAKCIEMFQSYEDVIITKSTDLIEKIEKIIKHGNTDPMKAFDIIPNIVKDYPEFVQIKIMSRVFDAFQNYPQVDGKQILKFRVHNRRKSSTYEDYKADITKDDVISRVLQVIKCYPKVDHSKVCEESHFRDDLGLDEDERVFMLEMLELEFKLPNIPTDHMMNSCKLAVDYIYDHRKERVSYDEFLSSKGCLPSHSEDLDSDADADVDYSIFG